MDIRDAQGGLRSDVTDAAHHGSRRRGNVPHGRHHLDESHHLGRHRRESLHRLGTRRHLHGAPERVPSGGAALALTRTAQLDQRHHHILPSVNGNMMRLLPKVVEEHGQQTNL